MSAELEQDTKQRLHRLVDELPESELHAAERFLQFLGNEAEDPLLTALRGTPIDDEPVSAEEEALVQHARDQMAAGEYVTHEEARRRLLGKR
jgi:predicted transcriptional regulator